jgi:hypothetical protein
MDSLQRYAAGRIRLEEIRMNTNAAVTASFSTANRIYFFDLPYLYLNKEKSKTDPVYTLVPQRADDRYAPEVTNHWECRSVRANDVTFQFIICQTWTLPRDREERRQSRASFGSSAYFILSDGREATTSVKLSFGGDAEKPQPETSRPISPDPVVAPNPATPATDVGPVAKWKIPESSSKLVDVEKSEFRIRFSPQTWANKSGAAQILADQKMSSLTGTKPPVGTDYCVWQPGTGNLVSRVLAAEPETGVAYTFKSADKDKASPASISVEMKTFTGSRLGTLQCFFQNADSVAAISVDRWVSIVGAHLTLEVLP